MATPLQLSSMVGWLMNDELEIIWKETFVTYLQSDPSIRLKMPRETTDNLRGVNVLVEVRTAYLPNPDHYCYPILTYSMEQSPS